MKFVEETGGQWAADKLRMAEADFEQQKREWEANRQAAQKKAEEEEQLQQQMEEDDYPLTYSSEDAKNQVKAKSNSRTVDQMSSRSSGGDVSKNAKRSSRLSATHAAPSAQTSVRTSSARRAAPVEQRETQTSGKKGRLSTPSIDQGGINVKTPNTSVVANKNNRRSGMVNGGTKGSFATAFISPGGKQMPRGKDTSTPIRKALRARYTSLTMSEESVETGLIKRGRSRSRQRGLENGDHHNDHGVDNVINCDEDSNSECSMDVMVDSNDATDSNRTGNDNDSVHSVTSSSRVDDEGGNSSVNSPRTRSRGSVKINLWTLDESPLPIVRMKPSRLATDSLNASSLAGHTDSEEGEDDDDRSLEEIRKNAADQSKTSVNGSPTSSRKRKGPSAQRELSEGVNDCKRMTRRASIMGHAKEHNNSTNGQIQLPVSTP